MSQPANRLDTLQQSLNYIERNLTAALSPQELADRAGYSLFYYYHIFQAAAGMPVMQYILRRRLSHAIYRIRQGQKAIDAALLLGFDTYAGFYKAFRREYGCSPSAYLKSRPYLNPPSAIDLTKEKPLMLNRQKLREALAHWGLAQEAITDIKHEGSGLIVENAWNIGNEQVLKAGETPGAFQNHAAVSKALAEAGLEAAVPCPTASGLEVVADGGLYFMLTRRLEGDTLPALSFYEGRFPLEPKCLGESLGLLHQILARHCHTLPCNEENLYELVTGWALPETAKTFSLPQGFAEDYTRTFGALYPRLPRQIIHRDIHLGNIKPPASLILT